MGAPKRPTCLHSETFIRHFASEKPTPTKQNGSFDDHPCILPAFNLDEAMTSVFIGKKASLEEAIE